MLNKSLVVPALIGLGLYAQNSEVNLANNTSILLILFLLLRDDLGGIFDGGPGYPGIGFNRFANERRYYGGRCCSCCDDRWC